MIYNSWTVQPNILMRLSSVPHECWCCIETFLGFLRSLTCSFVHGGAWHIMIGATFGGYVLYAWYVLRYAQAHVIYLRLWVDIWSHTWQGLRPCLNGELQSARPSLPHIECMWEGLRSNLQAPLSIFPFSWCVLGGGSKVSPCVHVGIQVRDWLQMVRSNCGLNHTLIPWVSEVLYYCNYLEFGIICMFLTSFYAHFSILCAQLVG